MKDSDRLFSRDPALLSEDELLDILALNAVRPVMDRKGKVCLRSTGRVRPTEEETGHVLKRLHIETRSDCRTIADRIRSRPPAKRHRMPITSWIMEERPRERFIQAGAASLPDSSLLAILLRTGREGASAEDLGRRLINQFGSFRGIDSASVEDLCLIEGIGPAKAVQIKAALEMGKRFLREKAVKKGRIRGPSDILDYVGEFYGPLLRDARKEVFSIIVMDIKNKPIDHIEISRGSISASIVDPGEIIREAAVRYASAVILIHNHPSGETDPSLEDIRITRRIVEACKLVDVKVLDHVIIGKNLEDHYSFARTGLIHP